MAKIFYRAIHTKTNWRKVSIHKSLHNALHGKDGAEALFAGTVRIDYTKHGAPIGVVAWEEGAQTAKAVRRDPAQSDRVQFSDIPIEMVLDWEHQRGVERAQFDALFELDEGTLFPEELPNGDLVWEGLRSRILVNRFERSSSARRKCIAHWGVRCSVCNFDFEKVYGVRGKNFIHVHHIVPIHLIGEAYELNPIEDLRPICPNCHAMVHRFDLLNIDQLKAIHHGNA